MSILCKGRYHKMPGCMVCTTDNLAYSANIHLYRYVPEPVSGDRTTKEKGTVVAIEEVSLGDCKRFYVGVGLDGKKSLGNFYPSSSEQSMEHKKKI